MFFRLSSGHLMSMTPEQLQAWRWEREIDERNRPLTDDELDAMFPEGYKVCFPFVIFSIWKKSSVLFAIIQLLLPFSPSPDLASASRLRAYSYTGPQVVRHPDAYWRHDGLPHAARGPHHKADERPTLWKPSAPQTWRHPVFWQTAGQWHICARKLQLDDCSCWCLPTTNRKCGMNCTRWRWMNLPWVPRSKKKGRLWSCCWR